MHCTKLLAHSDFCCWDVVARLNAEEFANGDAELNEDAMIAEYLASQRGDFECDPEADMEPREWPKGRGSKLLDQTLCVHLFTHLHLF